MPDWIGWVLYFGFLLLLPIVGCIINDFGDDC